jgi:hypothetical protein
MGVLPLIAEFENHIRRERQQDGINKPFEVGQSGNPAGRPKGPEAS